MKRFYLIASIMTVAALCITAPLLAQQVNPDRVAVAWSDPARPGLLKVNVHQGGISVKTHSGRDVIIESKSSRSNQNQRPAESGGLRRIDIMTSGLVLEEENNVMSVGVSYVSSRNTYLEIQVPARTNLTLQVHRGGDVVVDGVEGEIETSNHYGAVILNNVAGSIVANSHHGKVTASLRQITANKAMAFTSFHGNIDLTLPSDAKANMKLRSDRGEIYSDFDFQVRQLNTPTTAEDLRKQGGKFRIELNKGVIGAINGGGPEFDLRTYHGDIYVRKGK